MRSLREGTEPRRMRGTLREGERALRLGKKPRMPRGVLFLLAGVTLFCLGTLLCLLATTVSEVPFAVAGADVGHVDGEALAPLAEYGSLPLTPAEEAGDTDERPEARGDPPLLGRRRRS